MPKAKAVKIAESADLIVGGYAMMKHELGIRIVNCSAQGISPAKADFRRSGLHQAQLLANVCPVAYGVGERLLRWIMRYDGDLHGHQRQVHEGARRLLGPGAPGRVRPKAAGRAARAPYRNNEGLAGNRGPFRCREKPRSPTLLSYACCLLTAVRT